MSSNPWLTSKLYEQRDSKEIGENNFLKPERVTVCSFANTRWLYGIEILQVSSRKGELVGTQVRFILEPWNWNLQPDLDSQKLKELSRSLGGCSWFCIILLSADQLPVLSLASLEPQLLSSMMPAESRRQGEAVYKRLYLEVPA